MRHELDAREYKLLLNPKRFSGDPSESVHTFWNAWMKPLIDGRLGLRDGGEARHEGQFDTPVERVIRFWDTPNCILTNADIALRERVPVGDDSESADPPQITLKLRMPDLFVVAAARLPGRKDDAKTDFEEDIAPLEVDDPQAGDQAVVVSPRRSIRSRFSLSTTQAAEWGDRHATLGHLQSLFPTLYQLLEPSGAPFEPAAMLIDGPTIRELVFKGTQVKFGTNFTGKFALTLWYFDSSGAAPKVAEISFKCETDGGDMSGKAARRALKLFIGMQSELGAWVNSEYSSKTALALPRACGRSTG